MVLISHLYQFIYLKNYKVAGSSVESFFGQFCIDPSTRSSYQFEDIRHQDTITLYGILGSKVSINFPLTHCNTVQWINHKSAEHIKKQIGDDIFNRYLKFCVIRNPYDLIVSSYHWEIYRKLTTYDFKTYCKKYNSIDNTYLRQYNINNLNRILIDNRPICDYYIRYEHLREDIITLLQKIGITEYNLDNLPHHKSGYRIKDISYREYYDDETIEIVYQLFKTECDMFNYTF